MEIRYPLVLIILIIISILYYIFSKNISFNKFTKGTKIANTKYLKNSDKFKNKLKKYNYYRRMLLGIFCLLLLSCFVLFSRFAKVDTITENKYNRDIFLCMDASTSVDELNLALIDNYKKVIKELKGERFGVSIFNTSSVVLVPLTDDYDYVIDVLDQVKKSIIYYDSFNHPGEREFSMYTSSYVTSGTLEGVDQLGSSLIGDGLASCAFSFSKKDIDRTRLIIFSTDNDLQGTPTLTLTQAASLTKKNNIKVFGVGTTLINDTNRQSFKQAVEITNGKYYDYNPNTIHSIVNDIESTSKSLLKSNTITKKRDIPLLPFMILILSFIGFLLLRKKVIR